MDLSTISQLSRTARSARGIRVRYESVTRIIPHTWGVQPNFPLYFGLCVFCFLFSASSFIFMLCSYVTALACGALARFQWLFVGNSPGTMIQNTSASPWCRVFLPRLGVITRILTDAGGGRVRAPHLSPICSALSVITRPYPETSNSRWSYGIRDTAVCGAAPQGTA